MPAHETGLAFNGAFYRDVVANILVGHPHAAALLGGRRASDARSRAAGAVPRLAGAIRLGRGPRYQRPFRVLMAERFVDAVKATVTDPWLAALPLIGSADQLIDATDVLQYPERVARLRPLYVPTQS